MKEPNSSKAAVRTDRVSNRGLKTLLPILVLVVGAASTVLIVQARPEVEKVEHVAAPPQVRVMTAEPTRVELVVHSQGAVYAPTESDLVAEVSGRVVWVSPRFEPGGFFASGEELLRLEARDYELAVKRSEAQLAQAKLRLVREEAEADVARDEWRELGEGAADPLVLREPQLAEARAGLQAAEAVLAQAELDLERTRIVAPYAGRIRATRVDLGEFVGRGAPLATVYSVDTAEVRLPVPDSELAYLDLPLVLRGDGDVHGPEVHLSAVFAGRTYAWQGRIVRTEGEIDPRSRMVNLVARVNDPYGRRGTVANAEAPLAVGLFVAAEISGRTVDELSELPRIALRRGGQVLVVDEEDRLRFRDVEVLRTGRDTVLVSGGLEPGARVVVSPLDVAVDGMVVRPVASAAIESAEKAAEVDS